jgi:hypothetical protein
MAEEVPDQTFPDLGNFIDDWMAVAHAQTDSLGEWLEQIKYRGFDCLAILKVIKQKEASHVVRNREVGKLCAVLISRGSDITKVKQRMSPEGRAEVDRLQLKYGIQKGGKNYPKEVVTLSRIGATFPAICGFVSNLNAYEPKYGAGWGVVPKAFSLPQIPACFPKTPLGKKLLKMHRLCIRKFDKLVNKKPDFQNALSFQKVQFESQLGTRGQREDWCVELSILRRSNAGALSIPFTKDQLLAVLRGDEEPNEEGEETDEEENEEEEEEEEQEEAGEQAENEEAADENQAGDEL